MCTVVFFDGHYFGRTLDHPMSYGEELVFTPRNFPLPFRQVRDLGHHHGILGMAHVAEGYPLYYDAMNEHGLCMAGLHFGSLARYGGNARDRIAAFELIPWILGQCETAAQARELLDRLCLTQEDFSDELPAAPLHWLLADRHACLTIESMEGGLRVWENPVGVLTNAPAFDDQLRHLTNFLHLSPFPPRNRLAPEVTLEPFSLGMGAMGLPGDLSSQSRFVRAVFARSHAAPGGVERFFHILDTVRQTKGCCRLEDGGYEQTLYSSCCDMDLGIYCYTTCANRRITAVDLRREDPEGEALVRWHLLTEQDIQYQN